MQTKIEIEKELRKQIIVGFDPSN